MQVWEEREANYHFHLEHRGRVGGRHAAPLRQGGRARAAISISRKPKNGAEGRMENEKMPKMTVEKKVWRSGGERRLLLPFLRADDEERINVYEESRKR